VEATMPTGKKTSEATTMIDELSAYLDGELPPAARRTVEQRLAQDPVFRQELHKLERAWGMLDQLTPANVEESFSRSTMALVATAATEEIAAQQSALPKQRRLFKFAGAAGLLAAGLAGLIAGRAIWPNPNTKLLRDLPVLEEFDLYRHADSIEFLRELDRQGVFVEEPDHAS
jgi:anti-sigma factor RsiW